ncbi:hypothetical protein ACFL47_02750 [Candidatus Latescibacterota bacterium]
MNNTSVIESAIADTHHKAIDYINSHGWFPYFLLCFWCLVFVMAALVDYGLTFDFFYNIAKDDFGIVTAKSLSSIRLKACLGTSVVLVLECCFYYLSRAVRRFMFWCLFILIPFVLWNIGGAQVLPLLDNHVQNEYTEESSNDAFSDWLRVDSEDPEQSDKEPVRDDDTFIEESIGKQAFIKNAKWYRTAFLLFSFLGLIAIIKMKKIVDVIGNLARAKRVVNRYRLLERYGQNIQSNENDIRCLEDNKNILYRAAQEEVLAAFTCGLRLLKTRLNKLIIYGEKNNAFAEYSLWQKKGPVRVNPMNIEETKEIIKIAENSMQNIRLFDPDEPEENNSLGEAIDEIDPNDFGLTGVQNAHNLEPILEEV